MEKDFIERWYKYKNNLEDYFRNNAQTKYNNYINIVEALFDKVINAEPIQGRT